MPKLLLTENARRVLEARYLRRDAERRLVETPDQLVSRVARAVAHAETLLGNEAGAASWEERFAAALSARCFLPNSPTLMNAGTPLGQLSACFVLPVNDSMAEIFEALKQMALVQRTGGGTGFSFSKLRPQGDLVASTGGAASGPVSFMRVFDCATEHIKQGGKRRGANMGVLRVDHPDVLEFIGVKRDAAILRNFNLSVLVTNRFMEAVPRNDWYEVVNPRTGLASGQLRAGEVFRAIVGAAWLTGDPGLLFADAINRANPTPLRGTFEATNPCGEIPLLPFESCNLGSLHLGQLTRQRAGRTAVDWEKLRQEVRTAIRFLDDVVEVNQLPIPEIEAASRATRKLGLGVMGFAELLIRLGIGYGTSRAAVLADRLMRAIAEEAWATSRALAVERGAFPGWSGSVFAGRGEPVRNATCTAIAPTGTIGIIANTTPGIEPLFALAYRRTGVLGGRTLSEVNPLLEEALEAHHCDTSAVLEQVLATGRIRNIEGVPPALKRLFVTALEITPRQHLSIQAAFQRHVDNSVSKTINLASDAAPDDVADAYQHAWQLGLKGVTVYRYGSRSSQVLELGVGDEAFQRDHASKCDPEECRV